MTWHQMCDYFQRSFPGGTHREDKWTYVGENRFRLYDLKPTRDSQPIPAAMVDFARENGTITNVTDRDTGETKDFPMTPKSAEQLTWERIAFMQGYAYND